MAEALYVHVFPLRQLSQQDLYYIQVVQRTVTGDRCPLSREYELRDIRIDIPRDFNIAEGAIYLTIRTSGQFDELSLPVGRLVQYTTRGFYWAGAASHRGGGGATTRSSNGWSLCGERTLSNTMSLLGQMVCVQIGVANSPAESARPTLPRLPLDKLSGEMESKKFITDSSFSTSSIESWLLTWVIGWFRVLYISFQACRSESVCIGLLVIYSHLSLLVHEFSRWATTLEASYERSKVLVNTLPTISAARKYYNGYNNSSRMRSKTFND